MKRCDRCNGSKLEPGQDESGLAIRKIACMKCNGTGELERFARLKDGLVSREFWDGVAFGALGMIVFQIIGKGLGNLYTWLLP